jgi:hypothetical protein
MKNKKLLIIVGCSLAIYLIYLLVIRKWMKSEGMNRDAIIGEGSSSQSTTLIPFSGPVYSSENLSQMQRI